MAASFSYFYLELNAGTAYSVFSLKKVLRPKGALNRLRHSQNWKVKYKFIFTRHCPWNHCPHCCELSLPFFFFPSFLIKTLAHASISPGTSCRASNRDCNYMTCTCTCTCTYEKKTSSSVQDIVTYFKMSPMVSIW